MEPNDDDRAIRRIALAILNSDEDQAREELDSVIQAVEDQIGRQSSIYTWSVPVILIIPALCLILSVIAALVSETAFNMLLAVAAATCLIPLFMVWLWRRYQYGTGRLVRSREGFYADASEDARERLEKLFAYLQRESAPRAYYRTWRGKKQYLDRRYSFGKLRVLLLSEFASVRALCLSPRGTRISEVIKIEEEPTKVIEALDLKPKRLGGPGRKTKYRYDEAIISLIGDTELGNVDTSDRAKAVNAIKKRLAQWFESYADASGDIPRADLLAPYAEKIFTHLKKIAADKER